LAGVFGSAGNDHIWAGIDLGAAANLGDWKIGPFVSTDFLPIVVPVGGLPNLGAALGGGVSVDTTAFPKLAITSSVRLDYMVPINNTLVPFPRLAAKANVIYALDNERAGHGTGALFTIGATLDGYDNPDDHVAGSTLSEGLMLGAGLSF
jgi:hypothetical protein